MGFNIKTWNNPITIDANNLNRIEQGIKNSHDTLEIVTEEVSNLQTKQLEILKDLNTVTKNAPNILNTLEKLNTLLNNNDISAVLSSADTFLMKTKQVLTEKELDQIYKNLNLNSFLKLTSIKVNDINVVNGSEVNITLPSIDNTLSSNSKNAIANNAVTKALKDLKDSINIPYKLSQLEEDVNHQTVSAAEKAKWNSNIANALIDEKDPTVPLWAKQPTKPIYEWSEILYKPTIPIDNSQLINGAGYAKTSEVSTMLSENITPINEKISSLETTDSSIIASLMNKSDFNHTHDYLPLTGGTLSGNLTITNDKQNEKAIYLISNGGSYDTTVYTKRLDTGITMHVGIGSGGINHGIYTLVSEKKDANGNIIRPARSKWALFSTETDTFLNGRAERALKDQYSRVIDTTYLALSGGQMTGRISFKDNNALPEGTTTDFFLGIDSYNEGGGIKYVNKENAHVGSADCAGYLKGFKKATTKQTWGNQTGTFICGMDDETSGSLAFRRDNPRNGTLSMILDGTVYVNEGNQEVEVKGHTHLIKDIDKTGYYMTYTCIDATSLDENTWYPVTIPIGSTHNIVKIEIINQWDGGQPTWSTHNSKHYACYKSWQAVGSWWGQADVNRLIFESSCNWVNVDPVQGLGQITENSIEYVYVRGGGKYNFYISHGIIPVLHPEGTTQYHRELPLRTDAPGEIKKNVGSVVYTGTSSTKDNNKTISNLRIGFTSGNLYIWNS